MTDSESPVLSSLTIVFDSVDLAQLRVNKGLSLNLMVARVSCNVCLEVGDLV